MSNGSDDAHNEGVSSPLATPVVTAAWLVQFRWWVIAGAVVALTASTWLLSALLPLGWVAALLAVQFLSNLWLWRRQHEREGLERRMGGCLLLDVGILTALMLATGGPSNPFTISYLVYITLAAVTLNARWAWAVAATSTLGYGLLFITPLRTTIDPPAAHGAMGPDLGHQVGMGVAFAVAAILTAAFVTRIRRALEERERALAEAQRVAAQQERLASLTTLAAGAAHELATPLGAIAVASRELDIAASAPGVPPALAEDARLIRSQVERCREILDQMSGRADASVAHEAQRVSAQDLVEEALLTLTDEARARVSVRMSPEAPLVSVPLASASRALRTLIRNALDASSNGRGVLVAAGADAGGTRFDVVDQGSGMAPDVLARAGEPFFTTKPVGSGFGLGVFLARTFAERWGGTLRLDSTPLRGTRATLWLPAAGPHEGHS
jgi:two-component system sensor histidine kinase RegB